MNKWTIKKKAEDNNVLSSGTFINDAGTWKKVLNETKDITVLGVKVKVNIWHYEIDTNDKRIASQFSPEILHYNVVNMTEIQNKLNDLIKNQFNEQLSQFGKVNSSVTYPIKFSAQGEFSK